MLFKKHKQFLQGAPHKVLDLATSNPSGLQRTPCRFFEMFQVFQGPLVQSLKFIENTSKYLDLHCCLQITHQYSNIFFTKITDDVFQAKEKGRIFLGKKTPPYPGVRSVPALSHAKHLWVLHRGVRSRRHPHPLRNTHGATSTGTKWWK